MRRAQGRLRDGPALNPCVLLADADGQQREVARQALASAGYDVLVAGDGLEALVLALRHRPDLVFCDVRLSRLDGYQLRSLLRQQAGMPALAVVLTTTATDDLLDEAAGQLLGPRELMSKPYSADLLCGVAQMLIDSASGGHV